MIRLLVRREAAIADIVAIFGGGARDDFGKIRVAACEFRRVAGGQSERVVDDEHLAIAIRAGADADRWNVEIFRDARGDFARNGFEEVAAPRRRCGPAL